jgi:hypothetical protein
MNQVTLRSNARALSLALGTFALTLASVEAQTIYSHGFSGSGSALNGTAVDVGGQNWQAGNLFLDNGAAGTVVAGSANGQAAWLPFSPANGTIYTASATFVNDNPNWLAFGFMSALPPVSAGNPSQLWTATDFGVRHSNNGAYGWMLSRNHPTSNDQEGFIGVNTTGAAFAGGNLVDPTQPVTFSIVLDTMAATWTAEYFINGVSRGLVNLPAGANTGIGGIGFSHERNATANTGAFLDEFSLTQVPEPSTFAFIAMGGISALFMARRKK